MNAIIRPEYYVIPGKHPADCRCSQHALKAILGSAAAVAMRTPAARPADPKQA